MIKALLFAPMSSVHERFNIANILALRELGAEIHLLANFSCDDHALEYKAKCINEQMIVHDIPFSRHSLKENFKYINQIKELLKKQHFDIVHAHTETGGILLRLSMSADKSTKYVYTAHGMSFYKGSSMKSQIVYKPIERFICKKMDCNIAINQEEFEILSHWNESTAHLVHGAGFDLDEIANAVVDVDEKKAELGIPKDRKLILSVGELNENKNHRLILEAISKIPCENRPYLLICGEGEKREELKSLAKSFEYENSVFMPGYRYDMPEIFKIADLFVFPSYHEGLSFALMQAMAAKLPVLCTKIRGNTELLDDNFGGHFFQPNDAEGLSRLISKMLIQSNRSAFGDYNFKKIQLFSIQCVKRELLDLYRMFHRG